MYTAYYQHTLTPLFMKSYIVYILADDATERAIYLKVSGGKHNNIWIKPRATAHKFRRLPTQLIISPDFWAKILQIARPVNHSYLPPCLVLVKR